MEWKTYPAQKPGSWRRIGPGGGGALYAPTVSPHEPETVIAACDMSASYITSDGGKSWRQVDFQHWARCFCFDPADGRRIYAGANALYRSEDGGSTWDLLFPSAASVSAVEYRGDEAQRVYCSGDGWPAGRIESIAVDPQKPSRLAVGVSVPPARTHAEAGGRPPELRIYRSNDGGSAWCAAGTLAGQRFIELFFARGTAEGQLTAVTDAGLSLCCADGSWSVPANAPAGHILDAAWGTQRIYLLAGAPAGDTPVLYRAAGPSGPWEMRRIPAAAVVKIAVSEEQPDTVYASVPEPAGFPLYGSESPPPRFGVLGSADAGDSWDWKLEIGASQPPNRAPGWVECDFPTTWGGAPFDLGVSPKTSAVCYAVDWGTLYRTLDGGGNWEQVYTDRDSRGEYRSRGLDTTNAYGVFADPVDPSCLLLASTDVGLFRSTNLGSTWRHSMHGVPHELENTCYWVEFDPDLHGTAWSAWGNCHDLPRWKMFASGQFARYRGCLCKSGDSGKTWVRAAPELGETGPVTHVVVDPSSPPGRRTILAAEMGRGVMISRDGGATWERSAGGMPASPAVWNIAMDRRGRIYALCARTPADPGGLFCSDDGGLSWGAVLPGRVFPGAGLPAVFPSSLLVDPLDHDILHVACWPDTTGPSGRPRGGGLLVSRDRGLTWDRLLDERLHVYSVTGYPGLPDTLFAALFEGAVLRSDNRGRSWARLGGLDFAWPKTVVPDGHGGIYVSTFGSGVWQGSPEGTGEEGQPPIRAR